MEIFKILQRRSKYFYVYLILLGLSNAIWNNALLLIINNKVSGTALPFVGHYALLSFMVLLVLSYFISRLFQSFMLNLTINLSYEMGMMVFNKVRFTSYTNFVNYGKEKIYSILGDTQTVSEFPHAFVETFNSLVIFTVGLVYLFLISPMGAAAILFTLVVLAVIYYNKTQRTQKYVNEARELADGYNKNVIDLLNGFKEMKMSTTKSDNLFARLNKNREDVKKMNIKTSIMWLNNDLLGRYFWFVLIGVIIFALPRFFLLDDKMIASFIIILLFLMGPIASLINLIPYYARIRTAVSKLQQFDLQINSLEQDAKNNADATGFGPPFQKLKLQNIIYTYMVEALSEPFSVQIENLTIARGEIIFITGGNGSGKTTFVNILSGLYQPSSGNIHLNGHLIDSNNYAKYRDQLAVIFSDHYLFSENYENYIINQQNDDLLEFIKIMKLDTIVKINSKQNKLDIELSKGQQKRVSMIYALLEEKDILILDEWAADQDPSFRFYFYNHFLPAMKSLGKTVVMITHDDQYFKCADRIIKFDFGQVVSDIKLEETLLRV